jgi:hypothetical protein
MIAWVIALAVLIGGCPGKTELGEPRPLPLGQQIAAVSSLVAVVAAHLFSAIYLFVTSYLPANGWKPISGDVFAWFRPWFVFVRGHTMVVASWRAACEVLRTRLAGLGYTQSVTVETGRYTATMVLIHPEKSTFAAIALTINRAPRLQLMFISLLDGDQLLVTANDIEKRGDPLPHETLALAPHGKAQELPDLAPGSLLAEHERTLTWLGQPDRRATVDELTAALAQAAADRRRAFLARPIRNMWLAWWRATRRWRPDRGALRER